MINLKKNVKLIVIFLILVILVITVNHFSPNYFLVSRNYPNYGWDFYVKLDNFQNIYCDYLKNNESSKLVLNYKESTHNKKNTLNAYYDCYGYAISNQKSCNYFKQDNLNYENKFTYKTGWYNEANCYKVYTLF